MGRVRIIEIGPDKNVNQIGGYTAVQNGFVPDDYRVYETGDYFVVTKKISL